MVEFTDEEGYGKYLDLHELYIMYINLKGVEVNFRFSLPVKDLDI
jgi:Pre-mRNA-splicing factor SF3A3, of SF3a complex, Prp9